MPSHKDFLYTEDVSPYEGFFSSRILDLPCKHVLRLASEKANALYQASVAIGYPQTIWGYGSGIYLKPEENRWVQLHTIRRMIYKQFVNPFRLVIDTAGVCWPDNLHSAIRDVLVFGEHITLFDVWCYTVDLRGATPVVVNRKDALRKDVSDIFGAIEAARKRDMRAGGAVRAVGYTIGEFIVENGITREALGLTEPYYTAYRNAWQKRKGMD